jgi:hypothetical protein
MPQSLYIKASGELERYVERATYQGQDFRSLVVLLRQLCCPRQCFCLCPSGARPSRPLWQSSILPTTWSSHNNNPQKLERFPPGLEKPLVVKSHRDCQEVQVARVHSNPLAPRAMSSKIDACNSPFQDHPTSDAHQWDACQIGKRHMCSGYHHERHVPASPAYKVQVVMRPHLRCMMHCCILYAWRDTLVWV